MGADDEDYGLAVDSNGFAYLTGRTLDINFPVTPGAVQSFNRGIFDVFITIMNPAAKGSAGLLYSTYLGGIAGDWGNGIAVGPNGLAYTTGSTGLNHQPLWPVTANAFEKQQPAAAVTPAQQQTFGIEGGFAAILNPAIPTPTATPTVAGRPAATPRTTAHATPTRTPRPHATPTKTPAFRI